MVGLSHTALRSLVMEQGGVGLLFTEMLAAKGLTEENEKHSPLLHRSANEKPLFYQLFLSEIEDVEPAVTRLQQLGAQGIDLNLGCPAPKLRRQGAGCYLTKDRARLKKLLRRLRRSTDLPFSAKIRLGESLDENSLLELCCLLCEEGIDMLTVHARLNGEKFCRKPRWDWIGKIKDTVQIPVFANGGIFTVKDAEECLKISNADGLMIGRAAAAKPWIFSDISQVIYGMADKEENPALESVYFRFVELLGERFAVERRLGRLKQFTHYFAENYQFGHQLATSVQTSHSIGQAMERANAFFDQSAKW